MGASETKVLEPARHLGKDVVVCVDDDPAILAALRRLLRSEPYEVEVFPEARSALRRIERGDVSLVVTDHRMPGLCGADLAQEVRKRSPQTIRIMLTAYPGNSLVSYGLENGIDWLMSKPWNDEALKLTLRTLLRAKNRGRRPGAEG